jgi:hypothetical protein
VSDVYHWQRPEPEKRCSEWQLSAEGSVGVLRERLTAYVRSCLVAEMVEKPVSAQTGIVEVGAMNSEVSQGVRDSSEGPVLSDLLRDVPRLMSEEPKEILRFFVDVKAIYDLKLVPDNVLDEESVDFLWGVHEKWSHGMHVKLGCLGNIFRYLSGKG